MSLQYLVQIAPGLSAMVMALFFVCGAALGSFINCLAWRVVNGESVLEGRSHCPHCNHALGVLDLIPVASWIFLGGKCRHCKKAISPRYLAVELLTGFAFLCIAWAFGITVQSMAFCALCCILIGLSLVDLDSMIIPNGFILAGILVWLAAFLLAAAAQMQLIPEAYASFCQFGVMQPDMVALGELSVSGAVTLGSTMMGLAGGNVLLAVLLDSLIGAFGLAGLMLAFALVFEIFTGKASMGGGDIKLLFVAGLFLGFANGLFCLVLSCIIGIVFAAVWSSASTGKDCGQDKACSVNKEPDQNGDGDDQSQGGGVVSQGKAPSKPFPFGPSLAISIFVSLLIAPSVVGWYLGLF